MRLHNNYLAAPWWQSGQNNSPQLWHVLEESCRSLGVHGVENPAVG